MCALGTKGSRTYQKECARYVAGATVEQMKRAARGGRKGHHRLLLELALQRQDAEQEIEAARERPRPLRRRTKQSSSSSSSTTSSLPRRITTKRKRVQQEQMPRQPEPQKVEKKPAPPATTTGKGKEIGTQPTATEQEESPDMVDEILGRTTGRKQANGDGSTAEEMEEEKQEQAAGAKPRQQPAQPPEAWRKNTRPAEPQMPNKW